MKPYSHSTFSSFAVLLVGRGIGSIWDLPLLRYNCITAPVFNVFSVLTQGSQNLKIPGSPSCRYSSEFGSPKINLTSPNKKKNNNKKKNQIGV